MQVHSLIFEAVESLRQRKCRPERESIAHYVAKKSAGLLGEFPGSDAAGIKYQQVFNEIENIVDSGKLVKVEFKGRISYRFPEAFSGSPLLHKHSKILNSSHVTGYILSTVSELLLLNENYSKDGIPKDLIIRKLIELEPKRFNQENTKDFIDREVAIGTLATGTSPDHLFPKDLKKTEPEVVPDTPSPIPFSAPTPAPTSPNNKSPRKMRGKKAAASTSTSTAPILTPATAPVATTTPTAEEILAVKSSPPAVFRAYGRKSASFVTDSRSVNEAFQTPSESKNEMPVLENEHNGGNTSGTSESRPTDTPETQIGSTGRGVRNKRKKEVFDPSDVKPAKKTIVTTPVVEPKSTQKEKPAVVKKTPIPVTPPAPKKSVGGRKRKTEEAASSVPAKVTAKETESCDMCKRSNKNPKGQFEQVLVCSECKSKKYHPTCLNYTKDQGAELSSKGNWKCEDCQLCEICETSLGKEATRCVSSTCSLSVHTKCIPDGVDKWSCKKCTIKNIEIEENKSKPEKQAVEAVETKEVSSSPGEKKQRGRPPKKRIISLTLTPSKPSEPSSPPCLERQEHIAITIDAETPKSSTSADPPGPTSPDTPDPSMLNPAHWTPAQVELYFRKHGLHDEGSLFKEQEIDGLSLLLMRRQDIVHGPMKLLLGPALKVYKIVGELQQSTR